MEKIITPYKFVTWDVGEPSEISKIDILKKFKPFHTGLGNLLSTGVYKSGGWSYDCTDFLNKYLVKQYGDWQECYAPNKTILRSVTYGRIDKIILL